MTVITHPVNSRRTQPEPERRGMYQVTQVLTMEHGGRHPWTGKLVYRYVERGTLYLPQQMIKQVRGSYVQTLRGRRGPTWIFRYY